MWLAVLVAMAAAACGKTQPSSGDKPAATKGAPAAAPAPAADPERAESGKLEAAIECLNTNSGRVFEVRDGYLRDVDPATGVPLPNRPMNLMGLGSSEACERKVAAAAALTPAIPALDQASAAYVAALTGFRAAWDELDAYYKKGEHLDDHGAKAKLLHPKVMAAVDAFGGAHRALQGVVKDRNRKRHQAELAAAEQAHGRNLDVILGTLLLEAQTLLELGDAERPDAAAFEATLATYGKLVDEADAYATAHPDEATAWGSLANIRNYSKSFLAASKVIARKLSDPTPATRAEHEETFRQYNFLVDNFNHH
ncbi:MAG: DUF3829 domain-containing protein [Kofleriaceae bacterium]